MPKESFDYQAFMDQVKELAKTMNKSAVIAEMNMNPITFNSRLLNACTDLQLAPPQFSSGRKKKASLNTAVVRPSGKQGSGLRLPIPKEWFDTMEWGVDDEIQFTKRGKKLILQKTGIGEEE